MSETLQEKSRSFAIESESSERTQASRAVHCQPSQFVPLLRRTLAGEYLIMGSIVLAACNIIYWSIQTPHISNLTFVMSNAWIILRALGVGRGLVLTAVVSALLFCCVCLPVAQPEHQFGWMRFVCSPVTSGILLALFIVIDVGEIRLRKKETGR